MSNISSIILKLPGGHTYEKRVLTADGKSIEFVNGVALTPGEFNRIWNMKLFNKKYWPYQVDVPKVRTYLTDPPHSDPRVHWCYQNFKSGNWRYTGWNPVTFVFKREADAALFALKWT